MAQADLNQLIQAGGLQRQLAQTTLDTANNLNYNKLLKIKEQNFYQHCSRTRITINDHSSNAATNGPLLSNRSRIGRSAFKVWQQPRKITWH